MKVRSITAIIGGGLTVLSLISGVAFSRSYWGYWFSPPSLEPAVREFASLQTFVQLRGERPAPDLDWNATIITPAEIREPASRYRRSPIDYFWLRLHAAIDDANLLPTSSSLMPESLLDRVDREVASSRLLVEGTTGYPFAKRLYGFAAIGPARSGDTLVVLALNGSEMSNDHYPVYDFVYLCKSDRCRVVRENAYFEDVAGIEGIRWYWVSFAVLLAGVVVLISASSFWLLVLGIAYLLSAVRTRVA